MAHARLNWAVFGLEYVCRTPRRGPAVHYVVWVKLAKTPVVWMHEVFCCSVAWHGFGVHVCGAHYCKICKGRVHCNPLYAWLGVHMVQSLYSYSYSDEARGRDLRLVKRYASVTVTR